MNQRHLWICWLTNSLSCLSVEKVVSENLSSELQTTVLFKQMPILGTAHSGYFCYSCFAEKDAEHRRTPELRFPEPRKPFFYVVYTSCLLCSGQTGFTRCSWQTEARARGQFPLWDVQMRWRNQQQNVFFWSLLPAPGSISVSI